MRKISTISLVFFAALTAIFAVSCNSKPDNPNSPEVEIDFTIYPNTLEYQELNVDRKSVV